VTSLDLPVPAQRGGRIRAPALIALLAAALLGGVLALVGTPLVIVATILGTAALAVLVARPEASTVLFLGMLYVNIPVVAARFHGVPEVLAVTTTMLLVLPAVSFVVFRRQPVITTPVFWVMVLYLLALLLSAMFSSDPAATASWIGGFIAEGIVLYLLVTNSVRTLGLLKAVIWTLLVAGAAMGALSVFQEVTGTYENAYFGFAQTRYTPGFEVDEIEDLDEDSRPRMGGPIGEKNRYAQVMLVLLPLALFAAFNARGRWQRLAAIAAGLFILAGVILSFSRGGGVAVLGMLVVLIALRHIRILHALILAVVLGAGVLLIAPAYAERLGTVTDVGALVGEDGGIIEGAILGRATSNLAALQVFADYPALGVGPGQYFREYSQEYANELGLRFLESDRRAHNLYLEIAADTGVLGLGAFAAILVLTISRLWRCRSYWLTRRAEYANWATAFLVSVLGYMMSATFLHLSYARYFWLLIALANVAVWILDRERPAESPENASPARPSPVPS
jgi:putative inorganic carbon (hco3(-)) transporter